MSARRGDLRLLADRVGADNLLTDPASRLVYSRDASHHTRGLPLAVALPRDAAGVREVLRWCAEHAVPVVSRGTGTGLSGGAVPGEGEIVLSTARLGDLGRVDAAGRRVRVGAGVLNDQVSVHAGPLGLHFAPDPSSQSASSIGGNVAENAGGPHCLRYGVTLDHVLRLEWCDAAGGSWATGRGLSAERGIDLAALLCGSEGTLGVVTAADLKLTPVPGTSVTLAAFFPDLDEAVGSVGMLLGAALLPVAVEMIDQAMLEAVEAAFGFGFPTDVAAAMILEFAGGPQETAEDAGRARELLLRGGARDVRLAADEAERQELWKCRKKAFGAVGRLTPSYVNLDVVVPLGRLPGLVREIQEIRERCGVVISTAFHAGDGNLHPGVHYDDRDPESERRAHAAADEIMRAALACGGSISGEHGIGVEKRHAAHWQLDAVSLDLMESIRSAFDPERALNPDKALPPPTAAGAAAPPVPDGIRLDLASLTATVAAEVTLGELQTQLAPLGLHVPLGVAVPGARANGWGGDRTIASLIDDWLTQPALLAARSPRECLLEVWAETGDGRPFHWGAPVRKNVVGYSLAALLCGAGGALARITAATFALMPAPERAGLWQYIIAPGDIDAVLPKLLPAVAERGSAWGGLSMAYDPGLESLAILGPLRHRDWDILDMDQRLTSALDAIAPVRTNHIIADWPSAQVVLGFVPDWARHSPNWTVAGAETEGLGLAMPEPCPGRWIWQASPRRFWTPEPWPAQRGWFADTCRRDGRPEPLPEPAADVPRRVLRDIKRAFDPRGALPTPAWLREAGDG